MQRIKTDFPWQALKLRISDYDGDKEKLFVRLFTLLGVPAGESIKDLLPLRWSRSAWEYVAVLLAPDPQTYFEKLFIGNSGSVRGEQRGVRSGPFLLKEDVDQLPLDSLVEVRSMEGSISRYQRIYRLDPSGWYHVAYRQEDISGWDESRGAYRYRRFYPWSLILGVDYD